MLDRVSQKDEVALSALYDRYSGLVFSGAKRILQDTGATEEILHAISKLRRKSGKAEELDENGVTFNVDVESHAAQRVLLNKVRAVTGSLPEDQRAALECAYFEGMSHAEIARKTGQPSGTVKTRILSAMETLKQALR